jgi:glycosyltransferase involved in cell wall biosynthesis
MNRTSENAHPEISLVVPFFNEGDNLELLVEEIREALDATDSPYELLLVDDASDDGGPEVASRLAAADPRIHVVRHRRNLGQSAALVSGFDRARGKIVVTLDSDLQNDPADIPRLLAELDRCDVVCGVRVERRDNRLRQISSRIANAARNWMTRESITDVGCSLRAFRVEYLVHLPAFNGMHRFLPTLLRQNGARVKEVEVHHRPRRHGESKYGINNRLWRGIVDLFGVRWLQARWIDWQAVDRGPRTRPPSSDV